jgi:hypothetical protein
MDALAMVVFLGGMLLFGFIDAWGADLKRKKWEKEGRPFQEESGDW